MRRGSLLLAWLLSVLALAGCGDDAGSIGDGGAGDGGQAQADAANGGGGGEDDAGANGNTGHDAAVASDAGGSMAGMSSFSGVKGTLVDTMLMGGTILGARPVDDDKVLLFTTAPSTSMRVCRFSYAGVLDKTYGTAGCNTIMGFGDFRTYNTENFDADGQSRLYYVRTGIEGNQIGGKAAYEIVRLDDKGMPDASFGTAGVVQVPLSALQGLDPMLVQPRANMIEVLADGSMLFGGGISVFASQPDDVDWVVFHVEADGTLDDSFGTNGYVQLHPGGADAVRILYVAPDKSIFVGGLHRATTPPFTTLLAKLDKNGKRDMSFGDGGFAKLADDDTFSVNRIAVDAKGRVITAGARTNTDSKWIGAWGRRFGADGKLDSSFGSGGEIVVDFVTLPYESSTIGDRFTTVFMDGEQIVFAGVSVSQTTNRGEYYALMVVNDDGSLDSNFAFTPVLGHIWEASFYVVDTGSASDLTGGGVAFLPTPDGKKIIGIGNTQVGSNPKNIAFVDWE